MYQIEAISNRLGWWISWYLFWLYSPFLQGIQNKQFK